MNSSQNKLQTEYEELKKKIQDRVRQLENKCVDQNKTVATISGGCNMHGHHHYHSHCHCQQNLNEDKKSNLNYGQRDELSSKITQKQIFANNNNITETILKQNLAMQRQMNQNLRTLSQRISDLSRSQSEVHNSNTDHLSLNQQKSRSNLIHSKQIRNIKRTNSLANHSLAKENHLQNTGTYQFKERNFEKSTDKAKNRLKSDNKNKATNQQRRSFQQLDKEYYTLNSYQKCPQHEAKKMKNKCDQRKNKKQIYKDSAHRNRKHQNDHLKSAFYQQEKNRKQLVAKVAKNFFNAYGAK